MTMFSRLTLLSVAAFSLMTHAAWASEEELGTRLKNCSIITSMLTRSQCYDQVVKEFDLGNLAKKEISDASGKWKITQEKSPIDDSNNVYAEIAGDDYIQNEDAKFVRPSMVLRCMEGKLEGYVIWNRKLGRTDNTLVNVRVGKGEVQSANWQLSADREAAFIPDPISFTRGLIDQNVVFMKVLLPTGDPLTSTYDIRGVNTALQPLVAACDTPKQ